MQLLVHVTLDLRWWKHWWKCLACAGVSCRGRVQEALGSIRTLLSWGWCFCNRYLKQGATSAVQLLAGSYHENESTEAKGWAVQIIADDIQMPQLWGAPLAIHLINPSLR